MPDVMKKRVLVVHNTYRAPGGEDVVARNEAELLRAHGHAVREWWRSNAEVRGFRQEARAGLAALWSRQATRQLADVMQSFGPDVVHFHNTWFRITPAACWTARAFGAAVVLTLHNYRLLCPNAIFLRDGKPCEDCKTLSFPYPAVYHGCYGASHLRSLLVGATNATHRALGTWHDRIDLYIALTEFGRRKFIEGGLPPDRLWTKPNFVARDPGRRNGSPGQYAIYLGRLSEEKGIRVLLDAWARSPDLPLKIVGDGPLRSEVEARTAGWPGVDLLGWRGRDEVFELLKGARFLVYPSIWYEGFGLAVLEAFATGLPAVVSSLGSSAEIVADGVTGLHARPGDVDDLAARVRWAWTHPDAMGEMGRCARREYEGKYTADVNYSMLRAAYDAAVQRRGRDR